MARRLHGANHENYTDSARPARNGNGDASPQSPSLSRDHDELMADQDLLERVMRLDDIARRELRDVIDESAPCRDHPSQRADCQTTSKGVWAEILRWIPAVTKSLAASTASCSDWPSAKPAATADASESPAPDTAAPGTLGRA